MTKLVCPICASDVVKRDLTNKYYLRLRNYQRLYTCNCCDHCWRIPLLENDTSMQDKHELRDGLVRYSAYAANSQDVVPLHLKERAKMVTIGETLLDFGSGDGTFLRYMRSNKIDAWGVDRDISLIEPNLAKFIKSDVREFYDIQFDFIHANHVIEHVSDPVDTLNNLKNIMKHSSVMLVEVPNELKSLTAILKRALAKRSISATSLYEHQHYFSPKSLATCLLKSGFIIQLCCTPQRIKSYSVRGSLDLIAATLNMGDVIFAIARMA